MNLGHDGNITMADGATLATIAAYENVLIRMYGKNKKKATIGFVTATGYVAATIEWEKRKCRDRSP